MKVWLDDIRNPAEHGHAGWEWAKTANEAIALLSTRHVTDISLDHDLAWEHYPNNDKGPPYKEKTGYDVALWMERTGIWPEHVACHSMNPVGRARIEATIRKHNENR